MIIPMFREDYEKMSIEELVKERQKLFENMKYYEERYILGLKEEKNDSEIVMVSPSPEVIWSVDNENLIMLTQLIEEKRQKLKFL